MSVSYEDYCKTYIECYEKVNRIMKLIKETIYPDEYDFYEMDESLSINDKLKIIENDLKSAEYARETYYDLLSALESYYPNTEYIDSYYDVLKKGFLNNLTSLENELKNKYIPFIKSYIIASYPDRDYNSKLTDEEIWKRSLNNEKVVETLEDILESVSWAGMDGQSYAVVDGYIKEICNLNDFEFGRYTSESSLKPSIVRKKKIDNKINVDFNKFDMSFEDIYGQDKALEVIKKVLKRNIFFYNAENINEDENAIGKNPLATFMFYGPTGTGKTEVSKLMAKFLFGDEKNLLVLDMNGYKDSNVAANAIKGFPESYKDSEKGTDFTRFLSKNKYGVIVLDEFEKAPKDVREIFMTMLDEGKFKDALGNTYDLSGYIFVATTNASEKFEYNDRKIGFDLNSKETTIKETEATIKEKLRELFTAPIMNRFNNLVHFSKIEYDDALEISNSIIKKLCKKFENKRFNNVSPKIEVKNIEEISKLILKECNYEKDGVRSIKNVINDCIGSEIMEQILQGKNNIVIDCVNNKIVVSNIHTKKI